MENLVYFHLNGSDKNIKNVDTMDIQKNGVGRLIMSQLQRPLGRCAQALVKKIQKLQIKVQNNF